MGTKLVVLSDILDIKHGYAFKGEYFSEVETSNILLTPGNFLIGGGFKDTKFKYYDGDIPEDYILKTDDIIVTMTDLSKEADTLGFSAKVPKSTNKVFLHNQRIGLLTFKSNEFDKDFIYWLFRTREYQRFVAGSSSGATVKHTSPSRILEYKYKFPPLKTQKKIASLLSNYDKLIENNTKRIKLLESMAEELYKEWFVRLRFPDHERVEVMDGLPVGWERNTLNKICEITSSKRIFLSDYTTGGIPFYRGKEITLKSKNESVKSELFISYAKFDDINQNFGSPFVNDILITAVGTLGSIYLVKKSDGDFYFKDGNLIWLKKIKNEFSAYIYYFCKSTEFQHFIDGFAIGSSQKALTIDALKKCSFLYPDIDIVKKFNTFTKLTLNKIEILNLKNDNLKQTRDLLLPRLMSGKLNVEDLDII